MPKHVCPVCLEDITCKRCKGSGKYYPPIQLIKLFIMYAMALGRYPTIMKKIIESPLLKKIFV